MSHRVVDEQMQLRIMELGAQGYSVAKIAEMCGISKNTVNVWKTRLYKNNWQTIPLAATYMPWPDSQDVYCAQEQENE